MKNSRLIKSTAAGAEASGKNLAGEFGDYGQPKGHASI